MCSTAHRIRRELQILSSSSKMENDMPGGPTQLGGSSSAGPKKVKGTSGDDILTATQTGLQNINSSQYAFEIYGYDGNDLITGSTSRDLIYGGNGDDIIYGDRDKDTIYGDAGNDWLHGGAGEDTIYGGNGDDRLIGGTEADLMAGGLGNDTYHVDHYGDQIIETDFRAPVIGSNGRLSFTWSTISGGNDTVIASTSFTLPDYVENLISVSTNTQTVAGFEGNGNGLNNTIIGADLIGHYDRLNGLDGNDRIIGGSGKSKITGGQGKDSMTGGLGADEFIFWDQSETGINHLADMITDFQTGIDKISLNFDANTNTQWNGNSGFDLFTWIGGQQFSGTAGELQFANGRLSGDTNGDKNADFQILMDGRFNSSDFQQDWCASNSNNNWL